MLNEAFTPAEVQQALRKLNDGEAAGLSGEPTELLRCATLKRQMARWMMSDTANYQQVQHKRGQLCCCFVDLKGAYDSVPRKQLWQTLVGLGIYGNMIKGIRAYQQSGSCQGGRPPLQHAQILPGRQAELSPQPDIVWFEHGWFV